MLRTAKTEASPVRFACHRHVSAYHLRKLPRDGKTEARYTVLP
jgi:hypothetical protein